MSGEFLSIEIDHPCRTPSLRDMRKQGAHRATWKCAECGQVWEYTNNWAGDGWDRVRGPA